MLYFAEKFELLRMFPDLKNYIYGLGTSPRIDHAVTRLLCQQKHPVLIVLLYNP